MTTIKDIAEYTGVSATTVSNVIHGKSNRVSEETVNKIQNAIKELNYVPNLFARSLVSSQSKVVALIQHVPTSEDVAFSDESFQMAFLSTIERVLRENGYFLMFRRIGSRDELTYFLQNWKVDGLFITGICDQEFFDSLKDINTPMVLVDSYCYSAESCDIGLDDDGGGFLATQYLCDMGHRHIGLATSPIRDGYVMMERLKGYKEALLKNGITFDEGLVFEGNLDLDSCRKLAAEMVKIPELTGIFATTDVMAAGLVTAFREMGKKVPEDISIVGFDDSSLSQLTDPPLTTVRQDMDLKASSAAACMVSMLKGEKKETQRMEHPVKLVVRDSVAKID